MKKLRELSKCGLVLLLGAAPAWPQTGVTMEAFAQRLEQLERQNAEMLEEIRLLRSELQGLRQAGAPGPAAPTAPKPDAARLAALEERVELQAGRLSEQDEVKVESSQRVPLRLTGMALFNAFLNSRHGGTALDNPVIASLAAGPINSGATLRQSLIGVEFDGPEAVGGGKIRGSFLLDLFSGSGEPLSNQVRLRTASIEAQWQTRGFLVGQEKPIVAPREPNSLAQVGISPLTAAGNLWRWRPQVRFEQRVGLGSGQELRARIGITQTYEEGAVVASEYLASLEHSRPALEGHFQLTRRLDEQRRLEIAPGFHTSTTHVLGASVPSRAFSLDWFFNPLRRVEFTGTLFTGRNLANLGGGGVGQGFTIFTVSRRQYQVLPVRTRGGWAQVTFVATPRLSFNLFGGQDDPNNRDLAPSGIAKNMAYAANVFYRLSPNVVIGGEISQVRTTFLNGQRPLNNHYDLAVAYLF